MVHTMNPQLVRNLSKIPKDKRGKFDPYSAAGYEQYLHWETPMLRATLRIPTWRPPKGCRKAKKKPGWKRSSNV